MLKAIWGPQFLFWPGNEEESTSILQDSPSLFLMISELIPFPLIPFLPALEKSTGYTILVSQVCCHK